MADGNPGGRRWLRGYGSGLAVVLGWWFAYLWSHSSWPHHLYDRARDAIYRILSGFPSAAHTVDRVFQLCLDNCTFTFGITLFAATLAVPLAFTARMVARARVRAGHADFADQARSWLSVHRGAAMAIVAVFPLLTQSLFVRLAWGWWNRNEWSTGYLGAVAALGAVEQIRLVRAGMRALLAPTMGDAPPAAADIDPDEIRFDAVAVTRETRLAVVALALVSLATAAWVASLPILSLFKDPRIFAVVGGYVALAAGSALLFRGASKIAVGVDGIYVGGTSRARFYAYRDLDEVRVRNGDLELVRHGRVALRLQLHGEDATRRDAILARIRAALARVNDVARDAAANFVTSRSTDKVASAVRGGVDYRMPSVSHDALWALVEGSGVDATTRKAAAEALAGTGDGTEAERLRVAAARCADPRVRVALEELASAEDAEEAPPPARRSVSA